jgi:hypothetical protein
MPQITVWDCQLTKLMFREKSAYIKHLRQLGAQRFVTRNIERSWRDLKEKATSADDVCAWIKTNGRALIQMQKTLENLAAQPSERIVEGDELNTKAVVRSARRGPGNLALMFDSAIAFNCDVALSQKYIGPLVLAMGRLDGATVSGYTPLVTAHSSFRVKLLLSVEHWPWAVPYKLHDMAKNHHQGGPFSFDNPERAQYTKNLLDKFYPHLPLETLLGHLPVVCLLDDIASFTQWLEQYGTGRSPDKPMELPGNLNEVTTARM